MTDEETMLVETVRAFIDRDVKPTVREVEHANEYPEAWIEQMKRMMAAEEASLKGGWFGAISNFYERWLRRVLEHPVLLAAFLAL